MPRKHTKLEEEDDQNDEEEELNDRQKVSNQEAVQQK
jgi:hypothetical protein